MSSFNATSRPVEMRYYTVKEIMRDSGFSIAQVYRFLRQGNFTSELVQTDSGNKPMYSWKAYKSIIDYAAKTKQPERKVKVAAEQPTIEQLRKEHPLVENYDFFKTSYFPDANLNNTDDDEML